MSVFSLICFLRDREGKGEVGEALFSFSKMYVGGAN